MKSAGKARNNGLYRHIRTSKEIIRNLLNDYNNIVIYTGKYKIPSSSFRSPVCSTYGTWSCSSYLALNF